MIINYHKSDCIFYVDGVALKNFILEDGFFNVNFKCEDVFIIEVDHFIQQNIYYKYTDFGVRLSTDICDLVDDETIDFSRICEIEKCEFLPHSQTAFREIFIINPYLHYKFDHGSFVMSLSPLVHGYEKEFRLETVNEVIERFDLIFDRFIDVLKTDSVVTVPLSGGMDSRLLLNVFLNKGLRSKVQLSTTGSRSCGDIIVARRVSRELGLEDRHTFVYLEDFDRNKLLKNYIKVGGLVPLDRLLHPDYSLGCENVIISGIYGDVIFADMDSEETLRYGDYCKKNGVDISTDEDMKIIKAYDEFEPNYRLFRVLLRCQKLTRQSLIALQYPTKVFSPFLAPDFIFGLSAFRERNLYKGVVKHFLPRRQALILHQSSLSTFILPDFCRFVERQLRKVINPKVRRPYFDVEVLKKIGIARHEAPVLDYGKD